MENRDDNQDFIFCNVGMSFSIKRISSKQHKKYFYKTTSSIVYTRFCFILKMSYVQNIYFNFEKFNSIRMDLRIGTKKMSHHNQQYNLDRILWQPDRINRSPPFCLHLYPSKIHSHPMDLTPSGKSTNVHTSLIFMDFISD